MISRFSAEAEPAEPTTGTEAEPAEPTTGTEAELTEPTVGAVSSPGMEHL
jgi:hypothetical protein